MSRSFKNSLRSRVANVATCTQSSAWHTKQFCKRKECDSFLIGLSIGKELSHVYKYN
jgi:hypothetical protein